MTRFAIKDSVKADN
jgi:ribosomal protein S8